MFPRGWSTGSARARSLLGEEAGRWQVLDGFVDDEELERLPVATR
jgi:hypothetical protein